MPGWFGEGRPEGDLRELVVCKNGVLHIPTRKLIDHTPRLLPTIPRLALQDLRSS